MKSIQLASAALLALSLASCDLIPFTPQNRIETAKAQIAIRTDDPTTVQWSNVREFKGAVCGIVNAQYRTARYGTELEWSGPEHFVTIDGEPTTISNEISDCEKGVGAWSRCVNAGDEAKVSQDVEACKAHQADLLRQSNEQMDRFFKSDGLFQTGDFQRDRITWDERQKQSDKAPQGMDYSELSARVDSWKVWDRAYNAHMRSLPTSATTAQKVAAAEVAVREANAASEAFLRERGFR